MSEPFIGQITMFGGNFAPRDWAFCNGQVLSISQNQALFSLLGTTYGGDGITTFALPDLRGRSPMHAGTGPGLSPRSPGQRGGAEQVALTVAQLPSHSHTLVVKSMGSGSAADDIVGFNGTGATQSQAPTEYSGGGQPHSNVAPYQCVSFIIALYGVYPSRS